MASKRDMHHLIMRNGIYHFRGYVPESLRDYFGRREVHKSLGTRSHAEALHRRDAERFRFREKLGLAEQKRRNDFVVVETLTDDQIIDLSREVYVRQWEFALSQCDGYAKTFVGDEAPDTSGYEELAAYLRRQLIKQEDELGVAQGWMDEVLETRMIELPVASDSARVLRAKILEVAVRVQDDLVDMIKGQPGKNASPAFFDFETQKPRLPTYIIDGRVGAKQPEKTTLALCVEEFLADIRIQRQDKGYKSVASSISLIIDFFGPDMNVTTMRNPECRRFREFILKLPSNARKKYPLVPITKVPEVRSPDDKLMSPTTVNKILGHVTQFLNWCEAMEKIDKAPSTKNFQVPETHASKEKRTPFSDHQLRSIFTSSQMQSEAKARSPFFWAYVIGLYHGLRLNEIMSLTADSITVIDDVPCIDIRYPEALKQEGAHGRSKTIPRVLPMHPILVQLGFVDYVQSKQTTGDIFDGLPVRGDGYRSRKVSDKSRKFLDALGISKGGPTFHSLRHCFRDAMTAARIPLEQAAFFGGWTLDGVMNQTYGSTPHGKLFKDDIDRVTYGEIDQMILGLAV